MSFLSSHPWLVFSVAIERLPASVWGKIGQIVAMNRQIEAAHLTKRQWQSHLTLQFARAAHASAAIEGNPYSEGDAIAIALGKRAPKTFHDREINNLLGLYIRAAAGDCLGHGHPSIGCLCMANKQSMADVVHPDNEFVPGMVRAHGVRVGSYLAPHQSDCPELLHKFASFFGEGNEFWIRNEQSIGKAEIAIVKAIVAHLYVAWIHPFGDGNGRTSRLIEFMILRSAGLSESVGATLCSHYWKTRPKYYEELNMSSMPRKDWAHAPLGFIAYAVAGLQQDLQASIDEMLREEREAYWLRLLEEGLPGQDKRAMRLRSLAAYIADAGGDVSIAQMRKGMPHMHSYANLSYQSLARDLNALLDGGWAKKAARGKYAGCKSEWTTSKGEQFSTRLQL